MTVTIYRPQKCVYSMLDPFPTVISDTGNYYIKVYDIGTLFQQGQILILGSGRDQAIIDTRLFTYYDVI